MSSIHIEQQMLLVVDVWASEKELHFEFSAEAFKLNRNMNWAGTEHQIGTGKLNNPGLLFCNENKN